jgi:hypothetical protein
MKVPAPRCWYGVKLPIFDFPSEREVRFGLESFLGRFEPEWMVSLKGKAGHYILVLLCAEEVVSCEIVFCTRDERRNAAIK